MKIIALHPEAGFRLTLERPLTAAEDGCYRYAGTLHFPEGTAPAACVVAADGAVTVTEAPEGLGEKVRLLVRAAVKGPVAEGLAPPRRIQRWRDAR